MPKFNESRYSQSFIERERQIIKDLTDNTEKKIASKKSTLYWMKKRHVDYSKEVLERRMGLKKRMTREEEIMKLREKTGDRKQNQTLTND